MTDQDRHGGRARELQALAYSAGPTSVLSACGGGGNSGVPGGAAGTAAPAPATRQRNTARRRSSVRGWRRRLAMALLSGMFLVQPVAADGAIGLRLEYAFGEGLRLPRPGAARFAYTEQEKLSAETDPASDGQRKHYDTSWLSTVANGVILMAALGGMVYLASKNSDCPDAVVATCAVMAFAAPCSC